MPRRFQARCSVRTISKTARKSLRFRKTDTRQRVEGQIRVDTTNWEHGSTNRQNEHTRQRLHSVFVVSPNDGTIEPVSLRRSDMTHDEKISENDYANYQ